ncbi:MAG: two-component regulator propeller domain-containing protein [Melioribacteraceae bacterium]|nr:two-component regulator propeller domain-containing protein [Melioribacteraceae bacterium]
MKNITYIKFLLISIFIIGVVQLSLAQTANAFENISIKDGLSHNEIWDFEQDKYGYMWIATADGLNKYDGYSFTIYKNDPNDSTSIPANVVTNVLEDKNGELWISTSNGIAEFDRTTEQFISYRFANSSRENANFVAYLFEDSRGILWVASTDGIKSFDRETKTFKTYEVLRLDNTIAAQSAPAYNLVESPEGELYVSSLAFGLMRFDYENNLFAMLKLKDDFQKKLQFSVVFSTLYDSEGKIWYGSRNGLYKIDPKELTGEEINNPVLNRKFANASALYETKNREIWIGTFTDGLFRYSLDSGKFDRLPNQNRGLYGFYTDKTGLLWMGSFQGILKYNFDKAPYELYTLETSNNDSKPIIISFALSEFDQDKMWLGSNMGLYLFDRVRKTFVGNSSAVNSINRIGELRIEDIVETDNNKLYLGTTNNGLIEYDLRSGGIKKHLPVQYSRTSIHFGDVNVLLNDSKEKLWVGQVTGLSILNSDNATFARVPNFEHRQYSLNLLSFLYDLRESRSALSQIIEVGDYADLSKEFVVAEDSYVLISGIGEGNRQWGMVDFGGLGICRRRNSLDNERT